MPIRSRALRAVVAGLSLNGASVALAQEHPAQRLSNIVAVVAEEYAKAVDPRGRMISSQEYQEAIDFLADAREVADRLPGARAAETRAVLDSMVAAVRARRPPAVIDSLGQRFALTLGSEGTLALPAPGTLDAAAGGRLFVAQCASCHGARGLGDGPQAAGMKQTPPPAIGSAATMSGVTPVAMFRIISVGVPSTAMPAWAPTLSAADRWNVVAYLLTLRASDAQRAEGEGLYLQRCASCHGAAGLGTGDNATARTLTVLPPEIGSFAWQAERSDSQIFGATRAGMAGTPMPASRDLRDSALANVVAWVRSLSVHPPVRADEAAVASAASDTAGGDAAAAARRVQALLARALTSARGGRLIDAGDEAFDAYLAFEPLETPARAKDPGLVATMERHFAEFKGAVRRGDAPAAEQSRGLIEAGLPTIVDLTRPTVGAWGAFLESFLIILREGFEAILVIGAVVAFLLKTGHRERLRSIWWGSALGLLASGLTAIVLATILSAMPASREILEGVTMLVAVAVLFSVSYWLISKVEAAKWQQFIREKVTNALEHGGGTALAFVAFLAVYREGAETALFYQALFAESVGRGAQLALGILVGFAALALIFTLFYRYGVRIPLRPFFAVTSGLLYYLAFVFVGKGVRELQEGNVISLTSLSGFPNLPAIGLFASVETVLAQLVLLVLFVFALAKTFWPRRAVTLPTLPDTGGVATAPPRIDDRALHALADRLESIERRVDAIESGTAEERQEI